MADRAPASRTCGSRISCTAVASSMPPTRAPPFYELPNQVLDVCVCVSPPSHRPSCRRRASGGCSCCCLCGPSSLPRALLVCSSAAPPARLPDRQKPLPEGNHGVRSTRPGDADQHSYTRARRVGIIREQCKTPTAGPRQSMSRLHGPASTSSTAPVRAMPAHERLRAAVVCGRARAVPWLEAGVVEPPDL